MKKRNFYPKQVLRGLAGKDVQALDEAQQHALKFFMLRSRKYGIPVSTIQSSSLRADSVSDFETQAAAILANTTSRIFLKPQMTDDEKATFVGSFMNGKAVTNLEMLRRNLAGI